MALLSSSRLVPAVLSTLFLSPPQVSRSQAVARELRYPCRRSVHGTRPPRGQHSDHQPSSTERMECLAALPLVAIRPSPIFRWSPEFGIPKWADPKLQSSCLKRGAVVPLGNSQRPTNRNRQTPLSLLWFLRRDSGAWPLATALGTPMREEQSSCQDRSYERTYLMIAILGSKAELSRLGRLYLGSRL